MLQPCFHLYTEHKQNLISRVFLAHNKISTKFMEDINNFLTSIQQEVVAEDKTVKVARLIILLNRIEKELNIVKTNLIKFKNQQQKYKRDSPLGEKVDQKIDSIDNLLDKIRKARLNLNFYFI